MDNNLTRQIAAKKSLVIVGVKGLAAGTFSLLLTLALGKPLPAAGAAGWALLLGSISYGLSIQLFILAMRGLGAARRSTLFGIAPFVGTLLSQVLLRKRPPLFFWAAVPVMLAGAWLMLTENRDHHHYLDPAEHSHAHAHPDEHHVHLHLRPVPLVSGLHTHPHQHEVVQHTHGHLPDLDHRHTHDEPRDP